MSSKKNNGFGLIHQLAAIETEVRKDLGTVRHNIHYVRQILADNETIDAEKRAIELLDYAMEILSRVNGD